MKHRTSQFVFLAILATLLVSHGQNRTIAQTDKSASPLSDEAFVKGMEASQDLDFAEARRQFEDIKRRFPDHPAGPYYLASTLWFQTLTRPGLLLPLLFKLLGSETFSGDNPEKVDAQTVQQFRDLIRQASVLAEAQLKRDPRNVEALYFLGAAHGLSAAFKGTIENGLVGAMRDGSTAEDKEREVIRLDPNFHDAELTIGLHDYTVGSLPLPIKIAAAIANVRGSKKRGLATLERVAREGRLERNIARLMLVVLYLREKQYEPAISQAQELSHAYPRNYLFKLLEADATLKQAIVLRQTNPSAAASSERAAFDICDSLSTKEANRLAPGRPLELIHFVYGEILLAAGKAETAATQFLLAAAVGRAEQAIVTIAHLRSAQALDLAGKRREALAEYKIVLERPNVYESHAKAERGLR